MTDIIHMADVLLDRKAAAEYLGSLKPLSPGTLDVWDCSKRYDLKPVKSAALSVTGNQTSTNSSKNDNGRN